MPDTEKTLLIVDDDADIRELLGQFLVKHQYNVLTANDGIEMFEHLGKASVDLLILDMMLPGDDGITLCRKLQASRHTFPIIMLSAAGEETDRIIGLEVGADDYISKPFNPRELLARIRAILRRSKTAKEAAVEVRHNALKFDQWTLDLTTRQLNSPRIAEISLSAGEYDLLVAFLEAPQQVLSRDQLLDLTRHRYSNPYDRSIDMQVSRLRQKIEDNPKKPTMIKTVRGGGYILAAQVSKVEL